MKPYSVSHANYTSSGQPRSSSVSAVKRNYNSGECASGNLQQSLKEIPIMEKFENLSFTKQQSGPSATRMKQFQINEQAKTPSVTAKLGDFGVDLILKTGDIDARGQTRESYKLLTSDISIPTLHAIPHKHVSSIRNERRVDKLLQAKMPPVKIKHILQQQPKIQRTNHFAPLCLKKREETVEDAEKTEFGLAGFNLSLIDLICDNVEEKTVSDLLTEMKDTTGGTHLVDISNAMHLQTGILNTEGLSELEDRKIHEIHILKPHLKCKNHNSL